MNNAWYLITTKYEHHHINLTHRNKFMKKTQLFKFSTEPNYILHASVAHGIQYEENLSSHHGGMYEDGQADRLNPFLYSTILLRRSGEYLSHFD